MQNSHHQINVLRQPLLLLTAIYFVWLLAVLFLFGFTPTNDGMGYLEYASKCLAEGAPYPTAAIYHEVPFIWNIGIINFVELSLWLSGSIWPVLIVLCVMKAATALFTALTTKQLLGSRASIFCLLLFMLYPNNWGQSTMLSSEIPSTCLATAAIWIAVSKPTPRYFFLSGLLLALGNWFRPTAAIFLFSIIVFLLLFRRRTSLPRIASLLGGYALFIAVVGTSCYLRTGHFVYQARSYWFSMVDECYDGAPVAPHWNQPVWPEGYPRYIENHEQMDCFDYERIWKARSLDWLKDHKLQYLQKLPGRIYYMYQSDFDNMTAFLPDKSNSENNFITIPYRHLLSEANHLNAAQWLSLVCLVFYLAILTLAVICSFKQIRKKRYQQLFLPLFIVLGGTLALVLVMHGETRFKDPLMPYIFILAASIVQLKKIKTHESK